jgi:hypothetical protein
LQVVVEVVDLITQHHQSQVQVDQAVVEQVEQDLMALMLQPTLVVEAEVAVEPEHLIMVVMVDQEWLL